MREHRVATTDDLSNKVRNVRYVDGTTLIPRSQHFERNKIHDCWLFGVEPGWIDLAYKTRDVQGLPEADFIEDDPLMTS